MKYSILIIVFLFMNFRVYSNYNTNDTLVLSRFDNIYSFFVSEDEKKLVLFNLDNYIEIFEVDSMKLIHQIKVSKNAWLDKAFISDDGNYLYYDYGMQAKTKYKRVNLTTLKKEKVGCEDIPKGCSYKSKIYCETTGCSYACKNKPIFIKVDCCEVLVYFLENNVID